MFERFFGTDFFQRIASGTMAGVHDVKAARGLFKSIITALEIFLGKSNVRISWNSTCDKPDHVESLVIYDTEDDVVTTIPVQIGRSIVDIGGRTVFLAWERAAALLARAIIFEIERLQAGGAAA